MRRSGQSLGKQATGLAVPCGRSAKSSRLQPADSIAGRLASRKPLGRRPGPFRAVSMSRQKAVQWGTRAHGRRSRPPTMPEGDCSRPLRGRLSLSLRRCRLRLIVHSPKVARPVGKRRAKPLRRGAPGGTTRSSGITSLLIPVSKSNLKIEAPFFRCSD
jgi:hypothetical protein